MPELKKYSGDVDGIGSVEYLYEDPDGEIMALAEQDPWDALCVIQNNIRALNESVPGIMQYEDERRGLIDEKVGGQVEIASKDGTKYRGLVTYVAEVRNDLGAAVLTILLGDINGPRPCKAVEIKVANFFRENPVMH